MKDAVLHTLGELYLGYALDQDASLEGEGKYSAIHADVALTRATNLSVAPNHIYLKTVFSGGRGLFQRVNESSIFRGAEQAILLCGQQQW